jgi:hypothetical protein
MVDLAQTIEEWKDLQSVKVDDQVIIKGNWQSAICQEISQLAISRYDEC